MLKTSGAFCVLALAISSHLLTAHAFSSSAGSSLLLRSCTPAQASTTRSRVRNVVMHAEDDKNHISRRALLNGISIVGAMTAHPLTAFADADDDRIKRGYDTLVDLLENWSKYAGEGKEAVNGDNVRRQIGTVGNKSPLFNIRKVFLRKGVDIDNFEAFEKEYAQIEANSYSAIFADYSTSPKRGYQYIEDAKENTQKTLKIYKEMMKELGIPF